jgi:predicted O-methyltransferase YrrM
MNYPYPTLVPRIPLTVALKRIADRFALDADELIAYAEEDAIGGYHHNEALAKFPGGSVWGVEGQVLYALIRVLKPKRVLEIGSWFGSSMFHMQAALQANGAGKLTCVDTDFKFDMDMKDGVITTLVESDLFDYTWPRRGKFDFVFADANATQAQITHIWEQFIKYAAPGAMIVNHDAAHFVVGERVNNGIREAGVNDHMIVAVAPADCGLAIWRKPE